MSEDSRPFCPECEESLEPEVRDRRGFIRAVGERTAALFALGGVAGQLPAAPDNEAKPRTTERPARPAEGIVREWYASLTEDQKKQVVLPFDHGAGPGQVATRQRIFN